MLVYQIDDVEDHVVEELLKYIQTGSLPDSVDGEVKIEDNLVRYSYYHPHPCINEDADRRYSLKKSRVEATKQEIIQEYELRNI